MSDAQIREDLSAKALRMYINSNGAKRIEGIILKEKSNKARGPLIWIALSHTMLPIILYPILERALQKGDHFAWQLELGLGCISVAFWLIWMWSLNSPLPAAIAGLLLYTSMNCLISASQGPHTHHAAPPFPVGLIGLINMVLLIRAIMHGSRQRRLERTPPALEGVVVKMPGGIASGIWLYLALLTIVTIPLAMVANHDFAFKDIFKIHNFMAIVTLTWAIIAWRDTLPAYRKTGELYWYGLAVLLAVFTSLFATVCLRGMQILIGVKAADMTGPYFEHGYGWLTVIGMIAVYPAIFEEMAFRGVIVPCLHRALTENETIVLTGFMFMILHLSVFSAPYLLFVGCTLAYFRLRSGSIWPCVLMHFTHNAMCLVLDRFF